MLVARIQKEIGVDISLTEIFTYQTIRELGRFISSRSVREGDYTSIEPMEEREYYPLSSAQKRLYFLQQIDLSSISYNMPMSLPLGKNIDTGRLEQALKQLILRHESLRTAFARVDEEPVQRIYPADQVDFRFEYYDSDNYHTFFRPFDLEQVPLVRSGLMKSGDGSLTWMTDLHHIISDGTSQTVLIQDFMDFLQRYAAGIFDTSIQRVFLLAESSFPAGNH